MQVAIRLLLLCLVVVHTQIVAAQNKYPIVLVHGFAGWGRDELGGTIKYWGSLQGDLQEQLKATGHTVYTASVGPFSSNWDRACELYAQIKGGVVDYGANHAKTHGHARFGRNFTGLYPQWGEIGADGKINKVHLIGHSMGGQTIRMLTQMLNKGTQGSPTVEQATTHPLFAGGKDWVHSITTIASPNRGTFLADIAALPIVGELAKDAVMAVLGVLGMVGSIETSIYDPKLEQWGLSPRESNEAPKAYWDRISSTKIFQPGFKDFCLWSLSTAGAAEENKWVETFPHVYYYSYVTRDTHPFLNMQLQQIDSANTITMLQPLQPLADFIGGRFGPDVGFSTDWQANDGLVPTFSQGSDGKSTAVTYKGVSAPGQWHKMPQLNFMDHLAVIGMTIHTQVASLYTAHAKLLAGLPTGSSHRQLLSLSDIGAGDVFSAIHKITAILSKVTTPEDIQALCSRLTDPKVVNYCAAMLRSLGTRNLRG